MPPVVAVILSLLQPAIDVYGAFKGTAAQARASSVVQDAMGVIQALTPLLTQFSSGTEVTLEDVRASLSGFDSKIDELEALIAAKKK